MDKFQEEKFSQERPLLSWVLGVGWARQAGEGRGNILEGENCGKTGRPEQTL